MYIYMCVYVYMMCYDVIYHFFYSEYETSRRNTTSLINSGYLLRKNLFGGPGEKNEDLGYRKEEN